MLNRHVERLFWLYGMFPWKTDDGRIHVTIPLASDAGRLVGFTPRIKRIAALALTALKTLSACVAGYFSPPIRSVDQSLIG